MKPLDSPLLIKPNNCRGKNPQRKG